MAKRKSLEDAGYNNILAYNSDEDYYTGKNTRLPDITVIGKAPKKGLYPVKYRYNPNKWVSAKTPQLTIDDVAKAYTAVTVGLFPNYISAASNLVKGNIKRALSDAWLYNTYDGDNSNISYGVVGFSVPEGSLFRSVNTAAKATPKQWTAAQDAAIARGDIAEAQRLRDLHFKVSAPNSKLKGVYQHGTNETNIKSFKDKEIVEFNKNLEWVYNKDLNDFIREGYNISPEQVKAYNNGETIVLSENPIATYFSNTKQMANTYRPNYLYERPGKGGKRYAVRINAPTLKTINGNKANWNRILTSDNVTQTTREIESDYRHVVDAVKIKNISDAGKYGEYGEPVIGDVIINYNPKNIKSAQAVTYDDKGVRIPLGERDNFSKNNILWGLAPFIGLGTLGTMYGAPNKRSLENNGYK